ncbi:MAG: sugar kinase [Chloroflexi bacterium]|nr:sugar kinase [Chloroflexota bacterium]MBI3734020.1 sugar kinase [Chloroflexota bacterium]
MSILVVGSVALDSVQTPFGKVEDALGGSATFFATAASLYDKVNLVAVVGTDFPQPHVDFLQSRPIDLSGLQRVEGKTFRWKGRYDYDLNSAQTLDTQLNVFATFHPKLPDHYRDATHVFLANIDPELQVEVAQQIKAPKLIALDTMNYWIDYKRDALTKAISLAHVVLINEAEARQYGNTFSLIRAARKILALGPRAVIVKKGEYGAALFTNGESLLSQHFFAPAYPLEKIADPTGAGDSFAGGFVGYIARRGDTSLETMKRAIIHGCVVASFTVEAFSVERLRHLTHEEIATRYREMQHFTHFEAMNGAA